MNSTPASKLDVHMERCTCASGNMQDVVGCQGMLRGGGGGTRQNEWVSGGKQEGLWGSRGAGLVHSTHPLALLVQQQECSNFRIVWVGFDVQPRANALYAVLRGREASL